MIVGMSRETGHDLIINLPDTLGFRLKNTIQIYFLIMHGVKVNRMKSHGN